MRGIGLIAICGALAGCGGNGAPASPCGILSGAVSAVILNCTNSPATYSPVVDSSSVLFTGDGTSPVAGPVKVSFTMNGKPTTGTFHDGDAGLRFAQVLFDTSDKHEYDADYAGAPLRNGVGHLIVTVKSVDPAGDQFVLHGSVDASTLEDSAGPVCAAHVDF